MTRKDYKLIADAIKRARAHTNEVVVDIVASEIADSLKTENPNFDRNRFLMACGF